MTVEYNASLIHVLPPLPKLRRRAGCMCARHYLYKFHRRVKLTPSLAAIGRLLSRRFELDGKVLDIRVEVRRQSDRELSIAVVSDFADGEDCHAFIYGIHTLPREIDRIVGRIRSINGYGRGRWYWLRRIDGK